MKNIINFIKLDFLTIKAYRKQIMFLFIFPIFFTFLNWGTSTITAILLGYITVIASYPFSISENNDLEILYESLPINRKTVVTGRYIFAGFIISAAIILCLAVYIFRYYLMDIDFYLPEAVFSNGMVLIAFIFLLSCQMYIYFRFGYIKAKLLNFLLPFFVLFFVTISIFVMDTIFTDGAAVDFLNGLSKNLALFSSLALMLPFIFMYISCKLSQRYYVKRDL